MKFCFLKQVERTSHQKTSKNAKKHNSFQGRSKTDQTRNGALNMNFLTMQLEYLPCYQNNTSQYIVLVSKELERNQQPAKSKEFTKSEKNVKSIPV